MKLEWVRVDNRLEWADVGKVFLVREVIARHSGAGVGLTTIPKCRKSIDIYLDAGGKDVNEEES